MLINGSQPVNIAVRGEKIMAIEPGKTTDDHDYSPIHFTDAIAIPGLINSHDHLDFNNFSILGEKKYFNYTEWGKHIHETFKDDIDGILKIPKNFRTAWGMYKNLLAGVTTVVNHGPFLKIENPLINIHQEPQNLHSVQFEKQWKWKLNNPLYKNKDCVIHTGEGVDEQSYSEIDELLKYNLLKRNLVGVHGVAMNVKQAKNFKGLIWCPESNRVLLDKHANIAQLKTNTTLVFGTDSTLTGNWNIWQHLRLARSLQQVNDAELFGMITSSPAKLWNMNNGELLTKKDADIVIIKKKNRTQNWDDLFKTNPEDILLIVHKGKIRMFDKTLLSQLSRLPVNHCTFSQISIKGFTKFVEGDLPALVASLRRYNPNVILPFINSSC
jgi:cytosine/adenosine deaminase-related metal-dependent hydrolase